MRIVMFTNTYLPHVGGVAQSVSRFTEGLRACGHEVLVVAPEYDQPANEDAGVYRLPSIRNFNGSEFSLIIPIAPGLSERLNEFKPDILHAHHPFLIGDLALRIAANRDLPLVFTHHTMYEHYTHYMPIDLEALGTFILKLSSGYANLCNRVIAPSVSVSDILRERDVATPIEIIPTGVDTDRFAHADGSAIREANGIPRDAIVIGHVGRLAPEKNLRYLARAVADVLEKDDKTWFIVVGSGPSMAKIRHTLRRRQVGRRLLFLGKRSGQELLNAYHAMDTFVFSSKSETQGMVLVEALASSLPVVALDAPGARDVVEDRVNGRLIPQDANYGDFAAGITWTISQLREDRAGMRRRARESATPFDRSVCVRKLIKLYEDVKSETRSRINIDAYERSALLRSLEKEWDLWSNRFDALEKALIGDSDQSP